MPRGAQLKQSGSIYGGGSPGTPPYDQFIFLLRDDFLIDESAPLTSPRTCVPGPGILTIKDTENNISISDGGAAIAGGLAVPAYNGDPGIWGSLLTRSSGVASCFRFTKPDITSSSLYLGWAVNTANVPTSDAIAVYSVARMAHMCSGAVAVPVGNYVADIPYEIGLVMRELGSYSFVRGGSFSDWTLLWVGNYGGTNVYSGISVYDAPCSIDTFRVARLPGESTDATPGNGYDVFGHRDLDVTDSIAAPVTGNTFDHTPDFVLSATIGSLPAAGGDAIIVRVRRNSVTLNQSIWVQCRGDGTGVVWKRDGASFTNLAVFAATTGDLYIRANSSSIDVWIDSTLKASVTNDWMIDQSTGYTTVDAGGSLTNLVVRTLDGIANVGSVNHPGYGIATDVLAGPLAVNDEFTHEADCVFEVIIDVAPAALNTVVEFRRQDNNNYWLIEVDATGKLVLWEYVFGYTQRAATGAGVITGGERLVVICDDEVIKGYYDNTLAWTYSSAVNFKTETSGKVTSLGGGSRLSNLISWPRTLSNAPNTPGSAEANRGLQTMAAGG